MNNPSAHNLDDDRRVIPPLPNFIDQHGKAGPSVDYVGPELREEFEKMYSQRPPIAVVEPVDPDPLAELARLIANPPAIPPMGAAAAKGMRECFERVAQEILIVAQDGVARANKNLQEAMGYAEVIRQSGDMLCNKIETDAVRLLQYSRVMREARAAFGGPPPPEGG